MKNRRLKVISTMCIALIAGLGNIPYGFRFTHIFLPENSYYYFLVGSIFAAASLLANAALCVYSLMSINIKEAASGNNRHVLLISTVGAIPLGMITFLGYQSLLPFFINLLISWVVIIAGASMGYHPLNKVINDIRTLNINNGDVKVTIVNTFGGFVGIIVSMLGYFAAVHGLLELFETYQISNILTRNIAYGVAVITWIPYAALFVSANQQAALSTYKILFVSWGTSVNEKIQGLLSPSFILIALISFLSASAIAQMVLEILSPSVYDPHFFSTSMGQNIVHYFLAPLSFVGCACVNYFGIMNFMEQKIFLYYWGDIEDASRVEI